MLIFPEEIHLGSSLDEEEIVKGIAGTIATKTGVDFQYVAMAIMGTTGAIPGRHKACLRTIGEYLQGALVLSSEELEALFQKHGVVHDGTLCLPPHLAADLREKGLLR